jgi:hypothetical protein
MADMTILNYTSAGYPFTLITTLGYRLSIMYLQDTEPFLNIHSGIKKKCRVVDFIHYKVHFN